MIKNFNHFVDTLLDAGFSLGSNSEGIYSIIPWTWNDPAPYDTPVRWHTGDTETDPWEWRMRVLAERDDIAYGKIFFKKSGFITREWYPYFLAARRQGRGFDEAYADGNISHFAQRIYEAIANSDSLPVEEIKNAAGFSREDKAGFDRALTELQMMLYITMCGRRQRQTKNGKEYGWSSTLLCTTEKFWGSDVFSIAAGISKEEAEEHIKKQVWFLNPSASEKKIKKFIFG